MKQAPPHQAGNRGGMAMLRSALGRVSRRLSAPSAAASMTSQRGPEVLRTPPPPSLRRAEPLTPRPGTAPQLTRTFMSSAATGAAARTCRVPNLQGWQRFPVISKRTEGVNSKQIRFLSAERKESSLVEWLNRHIGPRR